MKNLTYIFDIGSSKISLLACKMHKGESTILTSINKAYDGFMDSEFFSNSQLGEVMSSLLDDMQVRTGKPVTSVCVGVPSEFCACICKRVTKNFVPAQKISNQDVEKMFDGVNDFASKDDYIVSSFSPLQFNIDGVICSSLSSKSVSQFSMDCCYILIKKQFTDLIKDILLESGVKNVEFVSTALAQSQFATTLLEDVLKPIAIVDVGHITTSVAVVKGEGLMMLSSFSLGGGHITADLMQVNNLSFQQADAIKRKVCLTVQSKKDERYIVYNNDKPIKALINITNDVVKARIENIASVVNRVLDSNSAFNDLPIYLTGDGVCYFRGVINLFEAVCNRKVYLLKSKLHNGEDKYQTSKIGLAKIIGDLV